MEIVRVSKKIAEDCKSDLIKPENIDVNLFEKYLDTAQQSDPDLIIRTAIRISNFLLWQIAYSELYFTETKWPDFSINEFTSILNECNSRDRTFGKNIGLSKI